MGKIGRIVLLAGNMAVGKSSIVRSAGFQDGCFFNRLDGWKIFGTIAGADTLNDGKKKYQPILQATPGNIVVTSCFWQYIIDLPIYSKNHHLLIAILETSKKENRRRSIQRSGKFSEDTWAEKRGRLVNLYRKCCSMKLDFIVIDNDRPLEEVKKDFWAYANRGLNLENS